jgi:hypothetical protein
MLEFPSAQRPVGGHARSGRWSAVNSRVRFTHPQGGGGHLESDGSKISSDASSTPVTTGPHCHPRVSPPMALDAGPMTGIRCIKRVVSVRLRHNPQPVVEDTHGEDTFMTHRRRSTGLTRFQHTRSRPPTPRVLEWGRSWLLGPFGLNPTSL